MSRSLADNRKRFFLPVFFSEANSLCYNRIRTHRYVSLLLPKRKVSAPFSICVGIMSSSSALTCLGFVTVLCPIKHTVIIFRLPSKEIVELRENIIVNCQQEVNFVELHERNFPLISYNKIVEYRYGTPR